MRYAVVATTGWLLLVDLQTRQVQPLECKRPEYYGISWFRNSSALVLSHSGLNNAELLDVSSYAQSERGWLSMGKRNSRHFLSQPHQLLCAPDGRVIVTNTGRNVITVFDFKTPNTFQESGISAARWDRLALDPDQIGGDHLNSVFLQQDRLYVLAHGHTKGSRLATLSYPSLELLQIEPLGAKTGLHNIWVTHEGQRISCHSENGSLIDLDVHAPLWDSGTAMYTRGLAASADYVLVGESQKTGRDLRHSSLSGLWILDRQSWRAADYLCLGPYGAVNEVRLLDVADDAHHGFPFCDMPSLLARDHRFDMTKQRLQSAATATVVNTIWSAYEPVFGSPAVLEDGQKKAALHQLCLIVMKAVDTTRFAFSYVLESASGAHVSAILGYAGQGGDTNMVAILLQPDGQAAALSVWRHDGLEWRCLPHISVRNLPLSGSAQLAASVLKASLRINDSKIITLTSKDLGLSRCDRGLGIRWMGATVMPVEAAQ